MFARHRTSKINVALAVAVALALFVVALPQSALSAKGKQARPYYWGAWIGKQLTGEQPPRDMTAVSRFEQVTGKAPSIVQFSVPFANCSDTPCYFIDFPTAEIQRVREYGAIPMLSWSSFASSGAGRESEYQLSDLINGTYDDYIREFAADAAAWGHPFFLRFNWEMNGPWFPWSEGVNGNQPGEYAAAWRHVHSIFASMGATNVSWTWCPYAYPRRRFRPLRGLYPGNAYVDWTCIDGYNWAQNPVNPAPWMSFEKIFAPTYRHITRRIAPRKPMLLGELASNGPAQAKGRWIRNMFKVLPAKFPRVRGLVWFNQIDRGIDWPLESAPVVSRAFQRGIRKGYRPNIYAELTASPIPPPARPVRKQRRRGHGK